MVLLGLFNLPLQAEHRGFILGYPGTASVYARALPLSMGPSLDTPQQLQCKDPGDMTFCHNELWCRFSLSRAVRAGQEPCYL